MAEKIKVVAFDFDGVIADTTQLKSDLFLKLFEGHAEYAAILAYEKHFQSLPRKKKLEEILGTILKDHSGLQLDTYLMKYAEALDIHLPQAPQIPGFSDFMKILEKNQIVPYIVSSGQEVEILQYLKKLGSNHFKGVFDAKVAKSVALQTIMKENGLKNSELLFLGDSLTDYEAAQAVACAFVAINPHKEFPSGVVSFKDFSAFDLRLLQ